MSGKDSFEIDFFERIHRRLPDYADVVEILGGLYTREGRIDEGLKMDRKLVRMMPENPNAHYNLACSLALKSRGTEAIRSLSKAVDLGYRDLEWLLQDPDLDSIKGFPRFRKLVSALKESN
jgi:tetratricopeptide (TPR) repeat protein